MNSGLPVALCLMAAAVWAAPQALLPAPVVSAWERAGATYGGISIDPDEGGWRFRSGDIAVDAVPGFQFGKLATELPQPLAAGS